MKTISVNIITACLAGIFLLSGCTKDLYDSGYSGNGKDNPLGINAPDNFDWSTIYTATLNVNVHDEFAGNYDYLIEIYDNNPLYATNAHLLGAGVASKGKAYTCEISYAQNIENIFIKQTDPKGRSTVASFPTVSNSGTINCYFNPATTAQTRAKEESGIPEYEYSVNDIPQNAEEITGDSHEDWLDKNPRTSDFKITGNYTGGIYHNGGKGGLRLFVSGTWRIPEEETGNWKYSIEKGLDVIILNGGRIITEGENKTLDFKSTSHLIVMEGGTVECEGSLRFTNNGYLYNKGIVTINEELELQSNSALYNFCSIKIQDELDANAGHADIYIEKGAVTAEEIMFNNANIRLVNGSMIKATENLKSEGTYYIASGDNKSLVKSPVIECNNTTYKDNMVIESDVHSDGNEWWKPYKLVGIASMAKYDASDVFIETCSGIENAGNPGEEPQDPKYPIIIDTTGDDYVFAMEDSWPSYGDYDMNDIVVKLSKSRIAIQQDNSRTITYKVKVVAMGANLPIAAAMQMEKVNTDAVREVTYGNPNAIKGFSLNSQKTENEQLKAVIPFFTNAKDFAGQNNNYLNVGNGGVTVEESSLPVQEITISFDNSVKEEDINIKYINFFITTDGLGKGRNEVHLAGHEPTLLGNTDLFGTQNDNSLNGNFKYLSKDSNLPWGLIIPTGNWKCPNEATSIIKAFPGFSEWAVSGGTNNKDWYIK